MKDIKAKNLNAGLSCRRRANAGFTLIEVIVAVAILSVSLVMIMQLFAAGLKASRASCDYTRAVLHARDKMEELSAAPIRPQDSGEFRDGYKWEADAQPYEEPADKELKNADFKLLKLKVKIMWNSGAKKESSVELESLKMVSAEDAKNL